MNLERLYKIYLLGISEPKIDKLFKFYSDSFDNLKPFCPNKQVYYMESDDTCHIIYDKKSKTAMMEFGYFFEQSVNIIKSDNKEYGIDFIYDVFYVQVANFVMKQIRNKVQFEIKCLETHNKRMFNIGETYKAWKRKNIKK